MQTLGLSDSTPRTESRLKSLLWPSIQTDADVDYLGVQGYWVCLLVATGSFVFMALSGQLISGFLFFLLFYIGGVGIRTGSRYAATLVLAYYVVDLVAIVLLRSFMLLSPGIVARICVTALLLSNLRATWLAAGWKSKGEGLPGERPQSASWSDKFADQFPLWLWPKVRVLYYVYSAGLILLTLIGLAVVARRGF
ncbi:MAG TPA: hypothetical protein VMS96_13595 [Terriglobales bacterium]|nr:hypothetical protein [Terriglobales bacterium]